MEYFASEERAAKMESSGAGAQSRSETKQRGVLELWRDGRDDAPALTLSDVSRFILRNFVRTMFVALAVGGTLFVASSSLFSKYSATATIIVDPRTVNVTRDAGVLPNIGADAVFIESLVQSTKTPNFLGNVVDRAHLVDDGEFGGRDDAIEKLDAQLKIARRGATYVIDATDGNRSPEKSARIADAAAQIIIDEQRDLRADADEAIAREIGQRMAQVSARVDRAEKAAAELKASLKVTDVGQGATLQERRVYELNAQLVAASARASEARARYDQLRRGSAAAIGDLSPTIQSTMLNVLRADYARLTRQAADQATALGSRHPSVAALQAQIVDAKSQIAAELSRVTGATHADFLEAQQKETALQSQLTKAQTESGDLAQEKVKLDQLGREALAERTVYEELLARQRQLAETKNLAPNDIHFVSHAATPTAIKPGFLFRSGLSLVLGLLCGLTYALARERAFPTLTTPRDVESLTGLKLVGSAPLLLAQSRKPRQYKSDPWVGDDDLPRPLLAPWVGELCALLSPEVGARGGRVTLIASPLRRAGRSTLAASCASALAASGARVLLIEADRETRPQGRRPFGLINVLASGEDFQKAVINNAVSGYGVLPFGDRKPGDNVAAGALMSGVTFHTFIKLCRQRFDAIVIDGPPALESDHGACLARQADLSVVLAEWNKTKPSDLKATLDSLGSDEAVVFFSKVDVNQLRAFDPDHARRILALGREAEDKS